MRERVPGVMIAAQRLYHTEDDQFCDTVCQATGQRCQAEDANPAR